MSIFDDARLPVDIERGAQGGPGFHTSIVTLDNGGEARNQTWISPLAGWDISYGIQTRDDLEALIVFFHGRRGAARAFRFRDWLDFTVKTGPVSHITGNEYQLVRYYDDPVHPFTKAIKCPDASTLHVYVNTVEVHNYTLGDLGVITFAAPPVGTILASFEFDTPARFVSDKLGVSLNTFEEGAIPSIQVTEVRL